MSLQHPGGNRPHSEGRAPGSAAAAEYEPGVAGSAKREERIYSLSAKGKTQNAKRVFVGSFERGEELKESIIEARSFLFAVRITKLYKYLIHQKNEYIISKQLMRSGTSIGANVAEGEKAQTKADFNAKMNVALKEANESYYWLKLLYATDYLTRKEFVSLEKDIKDIISILVAICRKTNK